MPEMPSDDVARAVRYYVEALGFVVNYQQTDIGVLDRDQVRLLVVQRTDRHLGIGSCYVYVSNVDDLCRDVIEAGADVRTEPVSRPWGLREFEVWDIDGNRLTFGEPLY